MFVMLLSICNAKFVMCCVNLKYRVCDVFVNLESQVRDVCVNLEIHVRDVFVDL